ncbi:MAG: putative DNA binding domain-containing protein [Desulfamplus sp.]|nr:putative DNA binding domain-containing protein [Desulfamplus sp.]
MIDMKENETIEFKKSLAELKAGLASISAILNKHSAGELWFGVRNDGKAVGMDVSEKTLRDISQAIAAHIEPRIYPGVTREKIDSADCIKIAFSGRESPYYAYGRAYMRVADEDRQLSAKELENLILARRREALRWDTEAWGGSLDELDEEKLKRFTERADLAWSNQYNVLEKLGLLREGRPVNAASLFFAKLPPMQLRCAVFAATDSATIIDRHDFDGDILELIEEAQKYILKNIHIGMRLKGLYREDVPEISIEALREAIINAFCHRDYRDPDYVQIAVFKNRVEIRNPGGLYGGLTIAEIRKGNVSKRRNPLIAELLRRIHMVESWGRGMPLILRNAPDVEFREVAGIFITGFDRPSSVEEKGAAIDKTIEETTKETIKEKAASTKETILNAIRERSEISVKELAELCALSPHGVQYHINKLKQSGVIRHVGATKAGRWEILRNEKS